MNFKIGTALPGIISVLVLAGMISAGTAAFEALERRQAAEAFLKVNHISQLLLKSAGQWAVERGMTNAPLKSPDPLLPERRTEIEKVRNVADQSFREAATQLRQIPTMATAGARISDAENTFRTFETFRSKLDEDLPKRGVDRSRDVVDNFSPAITNLIDVSASKTRITLETLASPPTATLTQLVSLRHMAAEMAENAGRERALLGGVIGANAKLGAEGIQKVSRFRGEVELAWQTISPISERHDVPAKLVQAIADVESEYFQTYSKTREAVLAAGESGAYKMSGAEYVNLATKAINSMLRLAEVIGSVADQEAAKEASDSAFSLAVAAAVLLTCIGLALLSFWVAFARILRPLFALTGAMGQLAKDDLEVAVPGAERGDEIGEMARMVEVFKKNGLEVRRMKAEQADAERHAAEVRKGEMTSVANDFENAIGRIVDTVASASTQLESSAKTLSATATRTKDTTMMVASASEEASVNVKSVAAATEELSSSVNEISRQVQESAQIAGHAVSQARGTTERVSELSRAASRIGDVVDLINTIAGQTNLLALNATIEAARAGEAGRGFAVVASEVKALAEQTANATGEIGQQIAGIQTATQESATAIMDISGTIERLSEISSAIAAAIEEQGAATQEISRNVQRAAHGTHQVSSNIADVQHGAAETGSASSQLLSAAQLLSRDSNRLKAEVTKFLSSVRAA
jgi:methyl-accepting chemotaxis protein